MLILFLELLASFLLGGLCTIIIIASASPYRNKNVNTRLTYPDKNELEQMCLFYEDDYKGKHVKK